jgi:hypothetical protein
MSIIERLKKNLSPEQYTAVMDALGDDFDFDLVPRARLNKVISQRNTLREQLASGLQTDVDDGDDGEGNEPKGTPKAKAKEPAAGAGTGDKTFTEEDLNQRIAESEKAIKMRYAAIQQLKDAGALDADLIFNSEGLLNKSKLTFEDAVGLGGLEDQITALKESKGFLFNAGNNGGGKGKNKAKEEAPAGTGKGSESDDSIDEDAVDAKLNEIFGFEDSGKSAE